MSDEGRAIDELTELQSSYDDLIASSREIEDALQQEVEDERLATAALQKRTDELEAELAITRQSTLNAVRDLDASRAHLLRLEDERKAWNLEKADLEQRVDTLEEQLRWTSASAEEAKKNWDVSIEDHALLVTEMEETKRQQEESVAHQHEEIQDLMSEVDTLRKNALNQNVFVGEATPVLETQMDELEPADEDEAGSAGFWRYSPCSGGSRRPRASHREKSMLPAKNALEMASSLELEHNHRVLLETRLNLVAPEQVPALPPGLSTTGYAVIPDKPRTVGGKDNNCVLS